MSVIKYTPRSIPCKGALVKVLHDPGHGIATIRLTSPDFGQLDITLAGRGLDMLVNDLTACQIATDVQALEAMDLAVSA